MRKKLHSAFLCAFLPAVFCVLFLVVCFGRLSLPVAAVIAFSLQFGWGLAVVDILYKDAPAGASPSSAVPDPAEPVPDAPKEMDRRGYDLFRRVVRYMEDQKPFLDDKLNLETFARAMFSNKVYVSKTINYYSGRNFRQFVNWYRIQYALELMRADPHLKMEEVSVMSGFHSTVSFNMAFRLFEGRTPMEWHEEYVDSLRKR